MAFPKGQRRDFPKLQARRLRAIDLLKDGFSQAEVARRVGVHRQSVSRWATSVQQHGLVGLQHQRAGRKPRLDEAALRALEAGLQQGPQALGYDTPLWTAPRVEELIRRQSGVRFHPDHVYRILQQLGWSCQRPVGRALERNEQAIRQWKRHRWPALKKKPSPKAG
jgi:transposase